MIFNIMLVSNQSGNITPRLPTCARHVVTLAELNFFGSSSRQAEQESGIAKDKSSSTSPPHGLHRAGIPASPHGRFIKPASTTSRPASAGPHYCFFKLVSLTPTYFDSSADIEASPSLHQPTPVMGVRIESQFWESPSFGLLQQISLVLLILVLFACLGSFFQQIITLVCPLYVRRCIKWWPH